MEHGMRVWWWMIAAASGVLGACTASACAGASPARVAVLQDDGLEEVSGLAIRSDGSMWVIQDSGNPPVVTGVDRAGKTVARLRLAGVPNTDWEDIVSGPCAGGGDPQACLYIAEFGDNDAVRTDLAILRIAVPTVDTGDITPEILHFRYPDHPRDAEALVVTPAGRIVVFSKRDSGVTHLFEVPAAFGAVDTQVATEIGELPVHSPGAKSKKESWVTSATLRSDGGLLLRTYSAIWAFSPKGDGWDPASAVAMPTASEAQGEAVVWDGAKGGYWQVSEGRHAPMYFTACPP